MLQMRSEDLSLYSLTITGALRTTCSLITNAQPHLLLGFSLVLPLNPSLSHDAALTAQALALLTLMAFNIRAGHTAPSVSEPFAAGEAGTVCGCGAGTARQKEGQLRPPVDFGSGNPPASYTNERYSSRV